MVPALQRPVLREARDTGGHSPGGGWLPTPVKSWGPINYIFQSQHPHPRLPIQMFPSESPAKPPRMPGPSADPSYPAVLPPRSQRRWLPLAAPAVGDPTSPRLSWDLSLRRLGVGVPVLTTLPTPHQFCSQRHWEGFQPDAHTQLEGTSTAWRTEPDNNRPLGGMPQGAPSRPPPPRENAHLAFPGAHSSTLGGRLGGRVLTKPSSQAEAATGGERPHPNQGQGHRGPPAHGLVTPRPPTIIRVKGALPPCPQAPGRRPVWAFPLARPPEAVHPQVEGGLGAGAGDAAQERGGCVRTSKNLRLDAPLDCKRGLKGVKS